MNEDIEEWTPATLFMHFTALRASDNEATKVALAANEKRLDGMNEFRSTLRDQNSTFVTRTELYAIAGVVCAISALLGGVIGHLLK
jgi:hypothetical protein